MASLKKYKFNSLYEMCSGISSKPEQAGHGSSFVSFRTVFNNYFLPEELPDQMDTSPREQETYSIKKGDILLTRTSETIDELAMSSVALKDYPKATYSGFVKRVRPLQKNITYDKYMGFYLRSKYFRKTMTNNAVMTLRASLNEEIFSYLDLLLPDFDTQKSIGDFLFLLDQKIDLNNKINKELESLARTLYNYWFVQFDFPISAAQARVMGHPQLEGKPYQASGGPMEYNTVWKREVPVGWDIDNLCNLCNIYQPKTISEKDMDVNAPFLVYGATGIIGKHNRYNHEESEVVITCRGANSGKVFRTLPKSWITGNAMVVHPNKGNIKSEYLLNSLKSSNLQNLITGSAQPQITRSNLELLNIIIPKDQILLLFNNIVHPNIKKRMLLANENQELTRLRDFLLPLLMNGQVRVKDAG